VKVLSKTYLQCRKDVKVSSCVKFHTKLNSRKEMKMKKLTVMILVVLMLVTTVVPAFAAGGPPATRNSGSGNQYSGNQAGVNKGNITIKPPYALVGKITAIDTVNNTVTAMVIKGNSVAVDFIGQEAILRTTTETRFLMRSGIPITFGDLNVGDNISSLGSLVDGVWTASRITSGALLSCLP
jgi:hypothetical protein